MKYFRMNETNINGAHPASRPRMKTALLLNSIANCSNYNTKCRRSAAREF